MKIIKMALIIATLTVSIASCSGQKDVEKQDSTQSYQEHTPTAHHSVALEVLDASKDWIAAFNNGNAAACIEGYDDNAVMSATPFGVKKGSKEISDFWTPFIASGATDLVYTNVSVEVANESTAFLSANWSMNVGRGIIYQEKWEKKNGEWLLTFDDFEVIEQFETPRENASNPVASHLVLEEVIRASIDWTNGFNVGESTICANGYADHATLNAIPFASINGKEGIQGFWSKLIDDGAGNLTYHNPTFKAMTDNTALLSSQWSMNIGEGKIYQEKWEKKDSKWLLTYDEFEVLGQY